MMIPVLRRITSHQQTPVTLHTPHTAHNTQQLKTCQWPATKELLPLLVGLGEPSRAHRRGLAVASVDRAVPIDSHRLRRRRRHLLPWTVAVLGVAATGRVNLAAVGRETDRVTPVISQALGVKALARGLEVGAGRRGGAAIRRQVGGAAALADRRGAATTTAAGLAPD